MNYSAEIKAFGEPERIARCLGPEAEEKDRSAFTVEKKEDHALIKVCASDSVALRATLNTITKLMTAYENIEKV